MATETATQLLDAAQTLVERRGYNAFSYKDLATDIGIKTASIHYHFPAKADLGIALMDRYLGGLEQAFATIDRTGSTHKTKLKKFIKLYRDTECRGWLPRIRPRDATQDSPECHFGLSRAERELGHRTNHRRCSPGRVQVLREARRCSGKSPVESPRRTHSVPGPSRTPTARLRTADVLSDTGS